MKAGGYMLKELREELAVQKKRFEEMRVSL